MSPEAFEELAEAALERAARIIDAVDALPVPGADLVPASDVSSVAREIRGFDEDSDLSPLPCEVCGARLIIKTDPPQCAVCARLAEQATELEALRSSMAEIRSAGAPMRELLAACDEAQDGTQLAWNAHKLRTLLRSIYDPGYRSTRPSSGP